MFDPQAKKSEGEGKNPMRIPIRNWSAPQGEKLRVFGEERGANALPRKGHFLEKEKQSLPSIEGASLGEKRAIHRAQSKKGGGPG